MTTPVRLLSSGERGRNRPRPEQLQGVEHPATVLLHPVVLGSRNGQPEVVWWAHEQSRILVGGLEIRQIENFNGGSHESHVGYLPTPIPRSWAKREFKVVVECESEHKNANFQVRLYYGCGDPSELRLGESEWFQGKSYGRERLPFHLKAKYLDTNELFRATIGIRRTSPWPVLIYGAWLEIGVED